MHDVTTNPFNGDEVHVCTTFGHKLAASRSYKYNYEIGSGLFHRWGYTLKDDPEYAPFPEIADIEIATTCHGLGSPCPWCYKSNTSSGEYMPFEMFKIIFDKFPKGLTQIAFGIGDIDSNPDMYKISNIAETTMSSQT